MFKRCIKVPLAITSTVALLALAVLFIGRAQENGQLVRPLPIGPAPPVVPQLPDLIGDLRGSASLCEARVQAVMERVAGKNSRVHKRQMAEGRKLYDEAMASQHGLVSFLQSGLARRFKGDDPAKVAGRFEDCRTKAGAFTKWSDGFSAQESARHEESIGGTAVDLLSLISDWLKGVAEQNDRAIELLRKDLEHCRMRTWADVMSNKTSKIIESQ